MIKGQLGQFVHAEPADILGVGMRLFYPEMKEARDIIDRTRAAIDAGAREMHYYNYGLVPAARLDWVRTAVDAVTV